MNSAAAQSILAGGTIQDVQVEGTQRIEDNSVLSFLNIKPGDEFDPVKLDQALKGIYATGLFADVTLRRRGAILQVIVVENPIINRIAFEGNDRIENEDLLASIQLRPRLVFTRTKVQRDAQRILEVYRRSGRFAVSVDPKVIQLDQNRIDLVFEINEGPQTIIESIQFIGNRVFSDGDLQNVITSTESGFFSFLSTSDTYDPDRLTFDRELLRRHYLDNGYADFRVESVVAELTERRESFIITFTVHEGERYKFSDLSVTSAIRDVDIEAFKTQLEIQPGDWYNAGQVDDAVSQLTELAGDAGFAFVDVKPKLDLNEADRTLAVQFNIGEGAKIFVERIDIEGNVRTLDKVIRREMQLVEGDAFNATKLRRSRQRIQDLGFFSTVEMTTEPGSLPDRSVVNVEVEDQSTGEFSLGLGYSSTQGPIANISLRERNLVGKGQDLRLGLNIAGSATEIDLSFTEPYFLDRDVAAGFDLFRVRTENSQSSFDLERIGGSLRAAYNLDEDLRHVVRYSAEHREISDISGTSSAVIAAEDGTSIRSIIGNELRFSKLDSRLDPSDGYVLSGSLNLAGFGGDVRFAQLQARAAYYHPLTEHWVVSVRGETGGIVGIGEDTSVIDRFFRGGGRPRGFDSSGIGPRDSVTNDALGGKYLYSGTLEFTRPIEFSKNLDVRGRVFADVASVWGVDDRGTGAAISDSAAPRVAVGFGLSYVSPLGPVVVDIGFPIVKESFDEEEILSFSFGTQF